MGKPPYADTAIHHLTEHLRDDPNSCAVQRALLAEIQDQDSTPERRKLAAELLQRWQLLVCPDYLSAFYGRQMIERAP